MLERLRQAIRHEEGATAVEYGIMVAAIAAVIITLVIVIGNQTCAGFETVADELEGPTGVASDDC